MHRDGVIGELRHKDLVCLQTELLSHPTYSDLESLTTGGIVVRINHKPVIRNQNHKQRKVYRWRKQPEKVMYDKGLSRAETLFGKGVVLEGKDIRNAFLFGNRSEE
jgi:hypothetical protein